MIIGKSLLKYKEGEPDVVGSFSMNRDENLTVVANRKNISDKEAFARLLLKMYKENSFHSIKFSTDHGYATSLDMTVYSWKEDIENGKSIMQIEFRPSEDGKYRYADKAQKKRIAQHRRIFSITLKMIKARQRKIRCLISVL